jgi:hypothetical protein
MPLRLDRWGYCPKCGEDMRTEDMEGLLDDAKAREGDLDTYPEGWIQ